MAWPTDTHIKKDWGGKLLDMGYPVPLGADLSLSLTNGATGSSGARNPHAALLPLVAESVALANAHDLELVLAWANSGLFGKTMESFEALVQSQGKLLCEIIDSMDKGSKNSNDKKKKREILPALPDMPKESECKDLLEQFRELLDVLKVNGGLVSNIVPAHMVRGRVKLSAKQ